MADYLLLATMSYQGESSVISRLQAEPARGPKLCCFVNKANSIPRLPREKKIQVL